MRLEQRSVSSYDSLKTLFFAARCKTIGETFAGSRTQRQLVAVISTSPHLFFLLRFSLVVSEQRGFTFDTHATSSREENEYTENCNSVAKGKLNRYRVVCCDYMKGKQKTLNIEINTHKLRKTQTRNYILCNHTFH